MVDSLRLQMMVWRVWRRWKVVVDPILKFSLVLLLVTLQEVVSLLVWLGRRVFWSWCTLGGLFSWRVCFLVHKQPFLIRTIVFSSPEAADTNLLFCFGFLLRSENFEFFRLCHQGISLIEVHLNGVLHSVNLALSRDKSETWWYILLRDLECEREGVLPVLHSFTSEFE